MYERENISVSSEIVMREIQFNNRVIHNPRFLGNVDGMIRKNVSKFPFKEHIMGGLRILC